MSTPKRGEDGADAYHEFVKLVALQERGFDSIKRAAEFIQTPNLTADQARARLGLIQKKWNAISDRDDELQEYRSVPACLTDAYFAKDTLGTMEEIFVETNAALSRIIRLEDALQPAVAAAPARENPGPHRRTQVPVIQLPHFSGNYADWIEFRDHFRALIINDPSYDTFSRLFYLKSCLQGDAAKLLKNLAMTADNFEVGWAMLTERYENRRRLLQTFLTRLFSVKPITHDGSPNDLRRLTDDIRSAADALEKLERPVSDDILVYVLTSKLDCGTRESWEFSLDGGGYATYEETMAFLNSKIRSYEASVNFPKQSRVTTAQPRTKPVSAFPIQASEVPIAKQPKCAICSDAHLTYKCPEFNVVSIPQRMQIVQSRNLCVNCLSQFHKGNFCKSRRSCNICSKRHHTLLHATNASPALTSPSISNAEASTSESSAPPVDVNHVRSHLTTQQGPSHTVLATAWVLITAPSKRIVKVRALLDIGATHTFISQQVANDLRTKTYASTLSVEGIVPGASAAISRVIPISVSSTSNLAVALSTDALILDTMPNYRPKFRYPISHWPHLENVELSDRFPTDDAPIHLIIGSDLFAYAMRDGIIRGKPDEPVALNTIFGWVLSGVTASSHDAPTSPSPVHLHHACVHADVSDALTRFWETEEVAFSQPASEENEMCERHFRDTHTRDPDGRYKVRIPFKEPPPHDIGDTLPRAIQCLHSIERRLATRPLECKAYAEFMCEYEELGHMRPAPTLTDGDAVYLPHHPVTKSSSTTTKTRVVFNASAASSNGKSLNDLQYVGPSLQADLPTLHTQWRAHRFVYAADIEKMYRQFRVDARDIDTQRILWRASPRDPIVPYQLLTVTYGTASAPFLALRVLKQLAEDEGDAYPLGKAILLSNFFVDDALFGADTIDEAKLMRDELSSLLQRGRLTLRKWVSNSAILLADIDEQNAMLACDKALQVDDSVKILGIAWHPPSDSYRFTFTQPEAPAQLTKRVILSQIARLFDPLGWVAPVVVVAKMIMQRLWECPVGWDSSVPDSICTMWWKFADGLPRITEVVIPRWLGIAPTTKVEIHGFSDASAKAYAAVVYVRCDDESGHCWTALVTAKTRVAPLKQISIPRLELCGAVLLTRLITHVRRVPAFQSYPIHTWTDSTIVLAWLKAQSSQGKVFVANRVAEIHTSLPDVTWRHVPGTDNPADLASRGLTTAEIIDSTLWWQGPTWLRLPPPEWPNATPQVMDANLLERRPASVLHATVEPDAFVDIISRFSSWPQLCRTLARILSLSKHWQSLADQSGSGHGEARTLDRVTTRVFRLLQGRAFPDEAALLNAAQPTSDGSRYPTADQPMPKSSRLRRLMPFLDPEGLIRVGGRLSLAQLPYTTRHPIVLPSGHVSRLLAAHAHVRCLHGGITLTLSTLRQHAWILQARKTVKSVVSRCIQCSRQRAEVPTQLMGSLPSARVNPPPRAFTECGVDYAGPVKVRLASGRGARSHPAYIALFICMASRAVHLELVSDYSTPAFLAAFQRFYSRRGLPAVVHSDCGTNFVGADKELRAAYQAAIRSDELRSRLADDGVEWKFIPPAAPHFGGLWEAGVRSMKHHLKRVLDPHTPTFEELVTLLCRIEACMNSRPLAPLTDSIESIEALTPAHFLIGGPLVSAPAPLTSDYSQSRVTRWRLFQQLLEQFWAQWSRDYVMSCQHRSKWLHTSRSVAPGQIVLMRNDNLPPAQWALARILECHPGHDGLIRVVTLRTASSTLKRPITKLALLPIEIEDAPRSRDP